MTRLKRLCIGFLTVVMLFSVLVVPASAASQDRYRTFAWADSERTDDSSLFQKANNSATYFRVTDNSMPTNGFYIRTIISSTKNNPSISSDFYRVTTYGGKTIKHNRTATNMYAGLRTYYPATYYSWGNVTLAWSEDYVEDGSERLNW